MFIAIFAVLASTGLSVVMVSACQQLYVDRVLPRLALVGIYIMVAAILFFIWGFTISLVLAVLT